MSGEIRTIAKLSTELDAARNELQQLVYTISHDLNTPMRAAVSFSELLKTRYAGVLDEKAQHYLAHIIQGCTKAQRLLEGLLNYSRCIAASPSAEKVDAQQIIEQCQVLLGKAIATQNATIETQALPSVRGDAKQLMQLFTLLLDNALKFTVPDTPPLIRIKAEKDAGGWLFSISDNGIGIEPPYQKTVFDIFRRLHKEEEYPGIGIGLTLAKKIVESHGGHIWIETAPGGGAVLLFTLPAWQRQAHA